MRVVEDHGAPYDVRMEILYPLPVLSGSEPAAESAITVLVNHTVSLDRRPAFLEALKVLLTSFDRAQGANGYKVFEKEDGGLSRITILQRFASKEDHEARLASDDFAIWRAAVAPLNPTLEGVKSYSGIAALFAAGQAPDAPPRWKMAVVLFIAVFPLSLGLSHGFGKALASTPPLIGALISSPIMVVLMTYVMVPVLTKIFARWLQPEK